MKENFIDTLLESVIIIEFLVIFFLTVFVYILYSFLSFRKKTHNKKRILIKKIFIDLNENNLPTTLPYLNTPDIVIRSFLSWNMEHQGEENWEKNKIYIMRNIILPKAIKYQSAFSWLRRFLLVQCLEFFVDSSHEETVIRLIRDKASVVSIDSTKVALDLGTKKVLEALVDRIALARHPFQSLYIAQTIPSLSFYEVLKEKLMDNKKIKLCKACYRILKKIGAPKDFYEYAHRDIQAEDLELKLAVIPIFIETHPDTENLSFIQILLGDKNWLVRNKTVQSMFGLKKEIILRLAPSLMKDENWWVRVNTAKLLSHLGEEGEIMLHNLSLLKVSGEEQEKISSYVQSYEPDYFLKIRHLQDSS